MKKIGSGAFIPDRRVTVKAYRSYVGKKEKEGPLGKYFDRFSEDEYFGQKTYEQAEIHMQKEVFDSVIEKEKLKEKDIDIIIAGDLLNQCVSSAYNARNRACGYLGLYGACSTFVQAAIIGTALIDGGGINNAVAVTSSHFCTAERQYRYPLEYGCQRAPSSQWTVTGAGAILLSATAEPEKPVVDCILPGRVTDKGICDINNMGAAMAPAAADSILRFFRDTKRSVSDYDLILTGDLGVVGSNLLITLLNKAGFEIGKKYHDCGVLIYDTEKQDVHSGGSGCGCCAAVMTGYVLPMMEKGLYKNVLLAATGALMSPTLNLQGESIPAISHIISLKTEG